MNVSRVDLGINVEHMATFGLAELNAYSPSGRSSCSAPRTVLGAPSPASPL